MALTKDVKTIWRYLLPYRKQVWLVAIVAVINAGASAFTPYIYGRLVDFVIKGHSLPLILGGLALWLAITLFSDWASRYSFDRGSAVALDAADDILFETSAHLMSLPLSFHKQKKIGEIIRKINRASDFLEGIINQVVFFVTPMFLTLIAALVIASFINWQLTLMLFLILILYAFVSVKKTGPIITSQEKINENYEQAYGDLHDAILNIQTVKSSTTEELEKKKMIKNFRYGATVEYKKYLSYWRDLNFWQQLVFGLGFMAIFSGALFMLDKGRLSAGQLVMFIGYINMAYRPFGRLGDNYRTLRAGMTSINRVLALLEEPTEPIAEKKGIVPEYIQGKIEFKNVSFGYTKDKMTLKNISLEAEPGQTVALVGESGVGKTTFADLISRYFKPNTGQILLDDINLEELNLKWLRNQIAVVPQEILLFNDTVKNNIAYGSPEAPAEKIIQAAKAANAHQFIEKFSGQYEQVVGERGIKLSTGQKQRIAIARAILRDPKILILDEATSALDSSSEKLVQEALANLVKGRTTFVIAHRLSTVMNADKIIVLEKGKIAEMGTHQELMQNPEGIYRNFWELQTAIQKVE